MSTLRNLLDQYRNRGLFPTYRQLADIAATAPALQALLDDYRHGAPFPSYAQLAGLAYA